MNIAIRRLSGSSARVQSPGDPRDSINDMAASTEVLVFRTDGMIVRPRAP